MTVYQVAKYITTKPSLIQIARDGAWEKAWTISLQDGIPSIKDLTNYLNQQMFQTVAIEAVFDQENGTYILGLDYNELHPTTSALTFLQTVINLTYQFTTFNQYLDSLDNQLVGHLYLLNQEPDVIRIGIVNHWFSVGPILIWQKDWPKVISLASLQKQLRIKPEVYETTLNYQGMSFVANLSQNSPGLCHWIKSPCGKKTGKTWKLDDSLILKFLKDWDSFIINDN